MNREIPFSAEAETGVIGSVLLLPSVLEEVATVVRSRDFYVDANTKIFGHMVDMQNAGEAIDVTLLAERMKAAGDLDLVGGLAYLGEVVLSVVNAANAVYYATIVREKAQSRELLKTLTEALDSAYDDSCKPGEQIKSIEGKLQKIAEHGSAIALITAKEAVMQALDYIAAASQSGKANGKNTGISDVDRMLGGLHGGELTILAARPSNGKSSFAQQIAEHVSEAGETVLYFTLEMAPRDLALRNMAAHAQVPYNELRSDIATSEQRLRALAAGDQFGSLPIIFRDATRSSTRDIRLAAKQLIRRKNKPGLIVVDYLGLLTPEDSRAPRHEQVGLMAKQLKELARDTDCPVLCLAQLNRESETKGRRPRVSDLRESGDIEAHADAVVLLHREDMANPDDPDLKNQAVVIVGKNRNGPCGDVKLFFDGSRTRFTALEIRYTQFDF